MNLFVRKILLVGIFIPLLVLAETEIMESNIRGAPIERVVWNKTPIPVPLNVGEERLVHFSESVQMGLSQELTYLLRSQSINGTLYLTAQQAFAPTRMIVRSQSAGTIYVLDISAKERQEDTPHLADLQIFIREDALKNDVQETPAPGTADMGYVALTRFAAQQLYAPSRLLPNSLGLIQVAVRKTPVDLVFGGQVSATPVASWRAGLRTITALKLVNTGKEALVLDPRALRGRWLAATFQHNRLLPKGDVADTTSLYLVSTRPFESSF